MISKASIAKHPFHPMLIPFPIALWVFSFICDIIVLVGGELIVWSAFALYTMAAGIIGALLAAIPGLVDLFSIPVSRARNVGIWHMSINLILVVMYVGNVVWRWNDVPGATGPFLLSVASIILLVASGWLGGELVYVHGVAVDGVGPEKL